jgi:amidase
LARFVEDIAVALNIISGTSPLDPTTLPLPLCDWRSVQLKDLRVGVFLDDSFEAPTPLAIKAVQDASDVLRIEGAKVIAARPPDLAESWNITQEYWRGYPDGANASLVYEGFLNRWDKYRVALGLFMQDFDLVIAPVDPLVYTCVFSLVGWPSVVVRGGTDRDGLPIGVQLIGKPWCDHVALAAAAGVERALGGWRPPRS